MGETENAMELLIMNLLMKSGDAKSLAMEAIQCARAGQVAEAKEKIAQAEEALNEAHNAQSGLMAREAGGEKFASGMLLNHSQDHLMGAITTLDLAKEIVMLWEFVRESKGENRE
ncbi:MAG: PTS lactose/cellobiose transporter subunit IIA [Lachnospiraceae bacterium]|jgi:PTS system cellobiose-specific IIA component|nr:PTS lactose/cellobiose transporter subunit IIA [Lachnospiraceae bacterium]